MGKVFNDTKKVCYDAKSTCSIWKEYLMMQWKYVIMQ